MGLALNNLQRWYAIKLNQPTNPNYKVNIYFHGGI